jgi:hypothetical protein
MNNSIFDRGRASHAEEPFAATAPSGRGAG